MMDRNYLYASSDAHSVPTPTGGAITLGTDGWDFANAWITVPFFASDRLPTSRAADDVEIQVDISRMTDAFGIAMGDGARAIALVLGPITRWVDPANFAVTINWEVPVSPVPPGRSNVLRLRKRGTGRWTLHVDGVLVAELPYLLAPEDAAVPYFRIGMLAGAAIATGRVRWYEVGLNTLTAPYEQVERVRYALPGPLQPDYNAVMRGILMTQVGVARCAQDQYEELRKLRGCDRIEVDSAEISGAAVPDPTIWTNVGPVVPSVVRGRLRLDASLGVGYYFTTLATRPTEVETAIEANVTVLDVPTFLPGNAAGLYLALDDGVKFLCAGLHRYGTAALGWRIGYGGTTSGRGVWPVNAYEPHDIQLRVTGDWVLLSVNGAVVNRCLYSQLPATLGLGMQALVVLPFVSGSRYDIENFSVRRYLSDQSFRPYLRQLAAERLFFPSGSERPDELRAWLDHRFDTLPIRATQRGLECELRRLCATDRVYVVSEMTPAEWILDVTFPPEIWLDLVSDLGDIYVEFAWGSVIRSLTALAHLIVLYFLPVSVEERQYYACLITAATAVIAPGAAVSVAVEASKGFALGDSVKLRSFDNVSSEACTVAGVPDATHVVLTTVVGAYPYAAATPPIIRKVLERS